MWALYVLILFGVFVFTIQQAKWIEKINSFTTSSNRKYSDYSNLLPRPDFERTVSVCIRYARIIPLTSEIESAILILVKLSAQCPLMWKLCALMWKMIGIHWLYQIAKLRGCTWYVFLVHYFLGDYNHFLVRSTVLLRLRPRCPLEMVSHMFEGTNPKKELVS